MANNPHAETYQGKTQFSGPIKAGSRWMPVPTYDRTTVPGTIAVTDLPNTGYVVCSQSCAVQQNATPADATDITLPSGSIITSIQIIVTTPFDQSADLDLRVGVRALSGDNWIGGYADLGAVGVYDYGDDSIWDTSWTEEKVGWWKDVSTIDDVVRGDGVSIWVDSGAVGTAGRAILTINYIPGLDLGA